MQRVPSPSVAVDAHGPSRTMSGGRRLLEVGYLAFLHPREIIVGLVVLRHVIPAEMIVLALRRTRLRCTVKATLRAIAPLAGGSSRLLLRFGACFTSPAANANAIEIFRVEFHMSDRPCFTATLGLQVSYRLAQYATAAAPLQGLDRTPNPGP